MSICFPGAIECARHIREVLGNECVIVIGGKHINETLWRSDSGQILFHPSGAAAPDLAGLFDIVVSGDAESVIVEIGEALVASASWQEFSENLATRLSFAAGDFLVHLQREVSPPMTLFPHKIRKIDPDALPVVYEKYPINTQFNILGGNMTAHAYSYSSRGCVMNCHFCSENSAINGPVGRAAIGQSALRLADQFAEIARLSALSGASSASVFVEDSILLQGQPQALRSFSERLASRDSVEVLFGAQLTIDMLLHAERQVHIKKLSALGLRYLFVGVETLDEILVSDIAKNTGRKKAISWKERVERVIQFLNSSSIDMGMSILFGLGESHGNRIATLRQIIEWQERLRQPKVVSLNWAVRHPMRDMTNPHNFRDWAVDEHDERLAIIMSLFGEATVRYGLNQVLPPKLSELEEIARMYNEMENIL
ncbi:MAG: hypothetical protein JSR55_05800 [Proteobacteria bacterium]|nr:hypothetical protein [Pseudomonadota bacterium]